MSTKRSAAFLDFDNDSLSHQPVKKQLRDKTQAIVSIPESRSDLLHPLTTLLTQYPFIDLLVHKISAKDLFSIATTSRMAYYNIFRDLQSRLQLTAKVKCDGKGVSIRKGCHQPSQYMLNAGAKGYVLCGSDDPVRDVPSRSCGRCGVNTCDECRLHLTYQTHCEPPDEPDELAYWSGHQLLGPEQYELLSPEHLGEDGTWAWIEHTKCTVAAKPYHDKGYISLSLDNPYAFETAYDIQSLIEANLAGGRLPILDTWSSVSGWDSTILKPFNDLVESRKRLYCPPCFRKQWPKQSSKCFQGTCQCTFRKQFLDPWVCLRCYVRERATVDRIPGTKKNNDQKPVKEYNCMCGERLDGPHVVFCLWCKCKVMNAESS